MVEYRAIYKCRLCGEEEDTNFTDSKHYAIKSIQKVGMKDPYKGEFTPPFVHPVSLRHIHLCKDGSVGLSDFQGWRVIKDGSRND